MVGMCLGTLETSTLTVGAYLGAPNEQPKRWKRKPTLPDLERLIRETYGDAVERVGLAQAVGEQAIRRVVACGGYLREAKASGRLSGKFESWVSLTFEMSPRTAQNYMRLHKWVLIHRDRILENKPHGVRTMYILAGITPEDETKPLPSDHRDPLARYKRIMRRFLLEGAAHRDYVPKEELWRASQPLVDYVKDLATDTDNAQKAKHVSGY